ncbi:CRTAC1 family protein [Acidobacteria bacterium AH-259-G07]|nr:CRTAC1 family protein [Acidobacteria bacterium AH-259-G07]
MSRVQARVPAVLLTILIAVTGAFPQKATVEFVDVGKSVGLTAVFYCGGQERKEYIVETLGSGVALFDYNNDGFLDVFFPNASKLQGFPSGQEPTNHLYHNEGDGTFTDASEEAGVSRSGWGQGVCAGDYDNDGFVDLYVTYWGENVLYRNNGNGTFTDVTQASGTGSDRWGTSCTFFDYDRDGRLDLFIANYVDFNKETTPTAGSTDHCVWKGVPVMCGPIGLKAELNQLFHNNGSGQFEEVSGVSGIVGPGPRYSLSATALDYNQDSWTDLYVAVDSQANILYSNNGDGTFTDVALEAGVAYNEDGRAQAGMGSDAGDYNADGFLDLITTNFDDDTSVLYRALGLGGFVDATYAAGLGRNINYLGWGTVFLDYDNDSWLDIIIANGHVYPEVEKYHPTSPFRQRKILYQNLKDGRFKDVTSLAGATLMQKFSSRGLAVGDYDNDGDLDVFVNNMGDSPSLFQNRVGNRNGFISIRTVGTKSNRDGLGARLKIIAGGRSQFNEARSGSSFMSHNDMRTHFGVGNATKIERIEIWWPSGQYDSVEDITVNQFLTITEGKGVTSRQKRQLCPG